MSMAVKSWNYTSRNKSGKVVKGKLEAPSESAVLGKLQSMGLSPLTVEEGRAASGLNMEISLSGFEKGVDLKSLAISSRQLATMISAGLPLLKALHILSEQTDNKKLKTILGQVASDVEIGGSFSDSLAKHPIDFPPLMISMIRAGETGGFLEGALDALAVNFEKDAKLRSTIKSAMTYPVMVLCLSLVAVIVMLTFIVPIFKTMFEGLGSSLPAPTQILVNISQNMFWIAPTLIVLFVVGFVWWRRNKNTEAVRRVVDPLKLRAPVFGKLAQKIAVARFTRNFANMIGAGVPILQALSVIGATSGNYVIEQATKRVAESVRNGQSLSKPLAEEPVFPPMVVQMMAVGEDAGSLEIMLTKIADFYDDEVQAMTEALTSLIEPLLIAFLGVVIGGMVVALYMPIFSIATAVNGAH
ncbi:MAG TPA: type II secretion system F family protein [Pseudolysinimonas sp.]|nr:type II secretion system F family protein [Pseudolysinimonas sp.]